MSKKPLSILTATFVIPLLLVACDRSEQSPTASADSAQQDKGQAMAPAPNDMMKDAPPAAGSPATPVPDAQAPAPDPSAAPSVGDTPPPDIQDGKKGSEY